MMAIIGESQNIVDVAITNYGSRWPEGIISLLQGNDAINLEEDVVVGDEVETPDVDSNDFVLKTYKANKYRVSTIGDTTIYQQAPEGDFMLTPEGDKIIFI